MLKCKPRFKFCVVLLMLTLHPLYLLAQIATDEASKSSIQVSLPETVGAETVFDIGFNITKDPGYVGNLQLGIKLPNGFELLKPSDEQSEFAFNGKEYSVKYNTLPAGEDFVFNLSVRAGNIGQAVYPLLGTVLLGEVKENFSTRINLISEKQADFPISTDKPDASVTATVTLPDLVKTDSIFDIVTSIRKPFDYNKSGQLRQKFVAGFEPQPTDIAGCDFKVELNEVIISWQAMASGEEIKISYPAKANQKPGGVYPILTSYSDESGLKFGKVVFVTLENNTKPAPPEAKAVESSIYKLSLHYPEEVVAGEKFTIIVTMQKGKNTGSGILELGLPHGLIIEEQDEMNCKYDLISGKWPVLWTAMQSSPSLETKLIFTVSDIAKAVYPVSARFIIDGNIVAHYFDNLTVVDKKINRPDLETKIEATSANLEIDTTSIYSKIDDLLNQWKTATNNPAGQSLETGKSSSVNSTNQPAPGLEAKTTHVPESTINKNPTSSETDLEIDFYYAIQVIASTVQMPQMLASISAHGINEPAAENYDGKYYRYIVGRFDTLKAAKEYLIIVKSKGYADAFIAEFINGKRGRIY